MVIAEDRLSELPDSLILYILSLINYPFDLSRKLKDVIRTSALSKRWQFIWTHMLEIDLDETSIDMDEIRRSVDYVGSVLAKRSVNHYLQRFSVQFYYYNKRLAPNLNSCVQIAVERNVRDISIYMKGEPYELHPILYSHSSLKTLSLSVCVMAPRETVKWQSLKSLSILKVDLSDCVIEKILSGCPILEALCLTQCRGFTCLNILSPTFTKLEINTWSNNTPSIDISAPYARELEIRYECSQRDHEITQFRLRDITSLVRASLDFNNINFRHEGNFRGILCIFKSSPYLETLIIECSRVDSFEDDLEEDIYKDDLVFHNLKTINITSPYDESLMIVAEFFLNRTNVLQKMNLFYDHNSYYDCVEELTENALALPKASPEAVVTVTRA